MRAFRRHYSCSQRVYLFLGKENIVAKKNAAQSFVEVCVDVFVTRFYCLISLSHERRSSFESGPALHLAFRRRAPRCGARREARAAVGAQCAVLRLSDFLRCSAFHSCCAVMASTGGVEGLLHGADLVAVFGGGEEVHLFGGLLHLALGLAYLFAQLCLRLVAPLQVGFLGVSV